MKATEKLLNNQIPVGAKELCCLTFHPASHLGEQRMRKVLSTVHPPVSWHALSPPGLLTRPSFQHPCVGSLMEPLCCSEAMCVCVLGWWWGLWGAEPPAPDDLTDAQVHLGLRGLWLLNCQHTHYNHISICSCGVHLWLVS